jgi:hypothetical protein
MRKEIALALIVVALVGGFLLGRKFPAHHYVIRGFLLFDEATGKVCNPMKPFEEKAADAKDPLARYGYAVPSPPEKDPFAEVGGHSSGPKDVVDKAAAARKAATDPFTYVPACD